MIEIQVRRKSSTKYGPRDQVQVVVMTEAERTNGTRYPFVWAVCEGWIEDLRSTYEHAIEHAASCPALYTGRLA